MSAGTWSFDRPRFYAVVISCLDSTVFELPQVDTWSFSKKDDGSAGSFTMRVPLKHDYMTVYANGAKVDESIDYARVAQPMDLVALYAQRQRVDADGDDVAEPIKPPNTDFAWGDGGALTVKTLGTENCIFIGMVDGIREACSPGSPAELTIYGRDLTKIFEVNWVGVPDTGPTARQGVGNNANDKSFFQLQSLELSRQGSGATFLLAVLDQLCAKDYTTIIETSKAPDIANLLKLAKSQQAALSLYGFPWRHFIRLDILDPDYFTFPTDHTYPPYTPQMGPVWTTVLELRNPPITRMFINELGQLVMDDAYGAWSGGNADSTPIAGTYPYANIAGTIESSDIREYDFGQDDADLITFLSIIPNAGTMNLDSIYHTKGFYGEGEGFTNGVMEAKGPKGTMSGPLIATLGYRYAQFESQWDLTFDDAITRRNVILTDHNSLQTGTVTLRGHPKYRVGKRFTLNLTTSRPDTTNQPWYITSVQQQGTWGEDWTTTLELRFPGSWFALNDNPPPPPMSERIYDIVSGSGGTGTGGSPAADGSMAARIKLVNSGKLVFQRDSQRADLLDPTKTQPALIGMLTDATNNGCILEVTSVNTDHGGGSPHTQGLAADVWPLKSTTPGDYAAANSPEMDNLLTTAKNDPNLLQIGLAGTANTPHNVLEAGATEFPDTGADHVHLGVQ